MRFFEMLADEVPPPRGAGPFDVLHDCGASDAELGGQLLDLDAGAVALEQLVDFFSLEAVLNLFLAKRSGSSSGWATRLLTSENLTKMGHDVVVGVTTQELHS